MSVLLVPATVMKENDSPAVHGSAESVLLLEPKHQHKTLTCVRLRHIPSRQDKTCTTETQDTCRAPEGMLNGHGVLGLTIKQDRITIGMLPYVGPIPRPIRVGPGNQSLAPTLDTIPLSPRVRVAYRLPQHTRPPLPSYDCACDCHTCTMHVVRPRPVTVTCACCM